MKGSRPFFRRFRIRTFFYLIDFQIRTFFSENKCPKKKAQILINVVFWYKTQHFRHFSSIKCRRRRPEEKFRFTWYVFVKLVIDFDRKYIEEYLFFSQSISKFPNFWIRTKNVRIFLNPESGKKSPIFCQTKKFEFGK